jgi:hypothetical protein
MALSQLGMLVVDEVFIGLQDKDKFNTSSPRGDMRLAEYVVPALRHRPIAVSDAESPATSSLPAAKTLVCAAVAGRKTMLSTLRSCR